MTTRTRPFGTWGLDEVVWSDGARAAVNERLATMRIGLTWSERLGNFAIKLMTAEEFAAEMAAYEAELQAVRSAREAES